jgi:integrase/recombinase XerD
MERAGSRRIISPPATREPTATRGRRKRTLLLDMRVIFVDILPGKNAAVHEERKGTRMPTVSPCLIRSVGPAGDPEVSLGVPLLDEYLEFLSGRCRPNTVLAVAYDLKVFFTVVQKSPKRVRPADVLAFMTAQRTGHGSAAQTVQPVDGERVGVSTRTLRRRLSSVSGLYAFLHARGDVATNPVPRGLPTRRERDRPGQGVPLVRGTRTLPRILAPSEVDALTSALRSHRDRAMVAAMVLGGLRRCEVIGLRLSDLRMRATGVHRRG